MSEPPRRRPVVVVMGATVDEPPPGIDAGATLADLSFAASPPALAEAIAGADAVFAWHSVPELLPEVWPKAEGLRWIQSASDGVDWLLFPDLVDSDVVVTNARGIFDQAIAEYVVGLMLAFAKGLLGVVEGQRHREWRHRPTEMLAGTRLLVAGVGPIGRAIGRAGRDLGMQVRGVGRRERSGDDVFESIAGTEGLAGAAGWADYVIDALPATPATRHVFDASVFGSMRRSARFLNVGRGMTVVEEALVDAIREGRIGGAALDVFDREPLPSDSPFWELPNTIVSPHMSGDFEGWLAAVVRLFVENLRRFAAGRPLLNVVDKREGYVVEPLP
ncbi:MAG TPA: D-2-hydroxyacid dehydrogenase [Actinomycetota bacterium]|nr:D-2-hydroxyacid dehydrogenase [Actinomycetota bacterium]